jgi:hypothetical protein
MRSGLDTDEIACQDGLAFSRARRRASDGSSAAEKSILSSGVEAAVCLEGAAIAVEPRAPAEQQP